jgi:hypothetical protein
VTVVVSTGASGGDDIAMIAAAASTSNIHMHFSGGLLSGPIGLMPTNGTTAKQQAQQ